MLKKVSFFLVLVLLAMLPFNALLMTYIQFGLGIKMPINIWKEVIVALITVLAIFNRIQEKRKLTFDKLDWAIIAFFFLGVVSSIFQTQHLGKIIFGFKYDFEFLWLFMVMRHGFVWLEKEVFSMIKIVSIVGGVVLCFGLLQVTVLPKDFMLLFGYSPIIGSWVPEGPLPMYHAADTNASLIRAASTLSGPNQLAMYCLILLFLGLGMAWKSKNIKQMWLWRGLSLLALVNLFFAYSRSAQIGAIIGIFLFLAMTIRNKKKFLLWVLSGVAGIVILLSSIYIVKPEIIHQVIIRASSSQGHYERSRDGVIYSLQNPLGYGLGNAGPASTRFNDDRIGWIPENWYLQISLELGIIGITLFLCIIYQSIAVLVRSSSWYAKSILLALIAISIGALFLHAWEESAVALTCWGLMGGIISLPKKV